MNTNPIVIMLFIVLILVTVFVVLFYCGKICNSKVAITEAIVFVRPLTPKTQPPSPINNLNIV